MSQLNKFEPAVAVGGGIIQGQTHYCEIPECGLPAYPYKLNYGQTGAMTLMLCPRHKEIAHAIAWLEWRLQTAAAGVQTR